MRWTHICSRHKGHILRGHPSLRSLGAWLAFCPHCGTPNPNYTHPAPAATSAGTVAHDYYDPGTAEVPPVGHPLRKLGSYLAEILDEDRWATAEQHLLAAWAGTVAQEDDEEAYQLGKRDGYEEAVQDIDVMTGGDGEYCYCTDGDPDRHTPDSATMKQRIADRFATLRAQLEEREAQLASLKESARKASHAIQMIPATPDGRLPHIGAAIRHLNEIAGLGCAALVTMPIGCAQCGEEHQNNTKEAWVIINLGCCVKCAGKLAQQDREKLAEAQLEIDRRHGIGGEMINARRERDAMAEKLAASEARVGALTEALTALVRVHDDETCRHESVQTLSSENQYCGGCDTLFYAGTEGPLYEDPPEIKQARAAISQPSNGGEG